VVNANKAYLPIELENGVNVVTIVLEHGTEIHSITESPRDTPWYSISGMKLNRPAAKGIYIQNGRKVIVK